jgi:hypothetical protein
MACHFPYDNIPLGDMPGDLEGRYYDADIGMYVNIAKETQDILPSPQIPAHHEDRPSLLRTFEPGKAECPDFIAVNRPGFSVEF